MLPLRARVQQGARAMKEVLCIPQSYSITGASPSDCLASYLVHSLSGEVITLCREAVAEFYSPKWAVEFRNKKMVESTRILFIYKIWRLYNRKKNHLRKLLFSVFQFRNTKIFRRTESIPRKWNIIFGILAKIHAPNVIIVKKNEVLSL